MEAAKGAKAAQVEAAKSEKAAVLKKLEKVRAENARKDVQIAELQAELIEIQDKAAKDVCVCIYVCIRTYICTYVCMHALTH